MYLRTTKRRNRDGSEVVYYQLAESVWNSEKRRSEAKVVHNFGRADTVDPEALRRLADSIRRVFDELIVERHVGGGGRRDRTVVDDLELLPAKRYGGVHVIEALWRRVGLQDILESLEPKRRGRRSPHATALFAMVVNRLLAPSSKLACYEWLQRNVHLPAANGLKLAQLYAALDFLGTNVEVIEEKLFWRVADLFSLDVDLIFFDTTTTYFEIDEPDEGTKSKSDDGLLEEKALRKRGYSKDKRSGNPQVVIGLAVTRDGLPVRSWVFPGNTVDAETVARVKRDLQRWRLSRILFVGDAGMYSAENKKILSRAGGRYLLATPLRKVQELRDEVLTRAGRYKKVADNVEVKEVLVGDGAAQRRYFLCRNLDEAQRQRRHREQVLEELKAEIAALKVPRKDDHPKRACALLSSKRYGRYLKKGRGDRLVIDRAKVRDEERFDGKWVVTTNDDTLSPADGALGYKAAMIIEACFRRMKTTGLKLRPVYHWTNDRIVAHVKLCVLALLLQRVAERACESTWQTIRKELATIQMVECHAGASAFLRTTRPSAEALRFLKSLEVPPPARLLDIKPAPAQ